MSAPQSFDALAESQEREDEMAPTMNPLSQNLGGLGSEGSSGRSESVFRDSTSSKRLGSAESGSSGKFKHPGIVMRN